MSGPILDVIVPAFNAEATLLRALESAAVIDGARVIVVDDGSEDATGAIARAHGARVLRQHNAGPHAARAAGLAASAGEFVLFLDADDALVRGGVHRSLAELREDSALAAVAGRVIGVSAASERLRPRTYDELNAATLIRRGFGPWPPCAAVVRRRALDAADALLVPRVATRFAEDLELVLRLSLVGALMVHDEVSAKYTLYAGRANDNSAAEFRDKETLLAHYAAHLGISRRRMSDTDIRAAVRLRSARAALARRDRVSAIRHLARAITENPAFVARKLRG